MSLCYARKHLLESDRYAAPHVVRERHFHGGFGTDGRYVSPRMLHRGPAIKAWARALRDRGGAPLTLDQRAIEGKYDLSDDQHRALLSVGEISVLDDILLITAEAEGRAGRLATLPCPDFSRVVDADLSCTALGHIGTGLLMAHGFDEAGDPATPEIGGHDSMWFGVRDLALGPRSREAPRPLGASANDSDAPAAWMIERAHPEMPLEIEIFLRMLMRILLSEVRANAVFRQVGQLLAGAEGLPAPPDDVRAAAALLARIHADEAAHIAYLRVALGEFRSLHIRMPSGRSFDGATIVDPLWRAMLDAIDRQEQSARYARRAAIADHLRHRGISACSAVTAAIDAEDAARSTAAL